MTNITGRDNFYDDPTVTELPRLRLFVVRRFNPIPEHVEELVSAAPGTISYSPVKHRIEEIQIEAHTAQTDPSGALLFLEYVHDEYTKSVRVRMKRAFASWLDFEEVLLKPTSPIF